MILINVIYSAICILIKNILSVYFKDDSEKNIYLLFKWVMQYKLKLQRTKLLTFYKNAMYCVYSCVYIPAFSST